MKTFLKSLRRQDGFTLVELMVVVAIIGLLSAVAIPNFKKYQAKAKMSEAKLQLSSVYTAETSFYSDFNLYANCIRYMGYDSFTETANRYYAIGFALAGNTNPLATDSSWISAEASGLQNTDCPAAGAAVLAAAANPSATAFGAGKGIGGAMVDTLADFAAESTGTCASALGTQLTAATTTFTASAAGVIDGGFTTAGTASCMAINEIKRFVITRNGF